MTNGHKSGNIELLFCHWEAPGFLAGAARAAGADQEPGAVTSGGASARELGAGFDKSHLAGWACLFLLFQVGGGGGVLSVRAF